MTCGLVKPFFKSLCIISKINSGLSHKKTAVGILQINSLICIVRALIQLQGEKIVRWRDIQLLTESCNWYLTPNDF